MQRLSPDIAESFLAVDSDGRIMCISPACVNILHTNADPVGRTLEEILGDSSDLASACREMFHHPGEDYPHQLQFALQDDTGKDLLANLYPLRRDDTTVGIVISVRPIRQARREEVRIRRVQRLNMLARLTTSLAHEIRNPLNAIVINLEVLKNTIKQLPPKSLRKANRYVEILSKELKRLSNVLDNFLGLAHPIEVVRSDIEVNQIVKDALNLMRHQAEQAGIEIRHNMVDSPIYVDGNADQLKQAILNLVLNAIEAMPTGGSLFVNTGKESKIATIQVADTGVGIPEEIQDDIFDFYFTTKEKGLGLGLPIVSRIVEFHRGGIDLESTEGGGTKFTIELPLSNF